MDLSIVFNPTGDKFGATSFFSSGNSHELWVYARFIMENASVERGGFIDIQYHADSDRFATYTENGWITVGGNKFPSDR